MCISCFRMDHRRMIDVTQPVPMSFIIETVGIIFIVIGAGIAMVKQAKRMKEKG